MNVVQLNNYIGKIATTLPIVHSYYNQSVYECWNGPEVKYGSFVFAVKNITHQNNTTRFDCIIYYGDRLNEDRSNCSAIQSDAMQVIQAVAGAIKNSQEVMDVNYPVQCVLFEQKFADELAGAYANVTIITEGLGTCGYEGIELPDYPEFIGGQNTLDNYYTKEQIDAFGFATMSEIKAAGYATKEDLDRRIGDIDKVLESLLNDPDMDKIKSVLDRVLYE